MRHPIRPLARRTAIAAVLCTLALALVPTAFGDPWGRDHSDAVARQALRPGDPYGHRSPFDGSHAGRLEHPASLAGRQRLRLERGCARSRHGDRGDVRRVRVCQPGATRWTASTRVIPRVGCRGRSRVPGPPARRRPIPIRPARAHELREIAALFAPALEPYRGSGSDWILDAYLAELVDVDPSAVRRGPGARRRTRRTQVVGTIACSRRSPRGLERPPGWLGGISALAVAPRMRGAGIGKALVQHCIERTRNLGAETLRDPHDLALNRRRELSRRLGFLRLSRFDLRAADIYPSEHADEMVGLAFRLDVEPATPPRLSPTAR